MSYITENAAQLVNRYADNNKRLTLVESCTGGGIAFALTAVPGSSAVFERGYLAYSNEAKEEELNVPKALMIEHGAVSEETAGAMATSALKKAGCDVAMAVTGVAGPSGGTADKPVGMVCFALATTTKTVVSQTKNFDGDREAIREQAIAAALEFGLKAL